MNIAFVGNGESASHLLEMFRKFTPNRNGIWGNLVGVDNYTDAEVFGCIDYLPDELRGKIDESKIVYLGAHPPGMQAYHSMDSYKCLAKYDLKHDFGFLEWWLDYDYDYLMALQPTTKTKLLSAVVSDARSQTYHLKRLEWLSRFCSRSDIPSFDLYGRIRPTGSLVRYYRGACGHLDGRGFAVSGLNHMIGKEQILSDTKFMLEYDANGEHYWSERLADSLLMWCYPIYWGGSGVHKYLPKESFSYLNIDGNGDDVLNALEWINYQEKLPIIAEARQLILNKYQIWARIHEAVFGKPK